MLLLEILGIDAGPLGTRYKRNGRKSGRPHEYKMRPRPRHNLMFKDLNLWHRDMYLTHNGNFDLLTDDAQKCMVACDTSGRMVYGKWDQDRQCGITFKKPRPLNIVVSPKMKLKRYTPV